MVKIEHLHKSFNHLEILKDVDLELSEQGITVVMGPNGSGKTTLIKSIIGQVIAEQGDIYFEGKRVNGEWEYRDQLSYLPQIANFPENLTVSELIHLIKDLRNKDARDQELVEQFSLQAHMKKRLSQLSGGTRQKVNIVLAFMFETPLIILDEPTVGLDPIALIHFKNLLLEAKKAGKLILITTHILSLVEEIADRIIFLLEGRIYFHDTKDALLSQYKEEKLEKAIAKMIQNFTESNND